MKKFLRNIALYALPVLIVAVVMEDVLLSLNSVAICIDASEWEIPEDGWYNATHLTKEASEEFTKKIVHCACK